MAVAARIHVNAHGYEWQLVAHITVVAGGNGGGHGHDPADTDYRAFHNPLRTYIGHDDGSCGGNDETSPSLSLSLSNEWNFSLSFLFVFSVYKQLGHSWMYALLKQ